MDKEEIIIDNFKHNEIVYYSIIILKGHVSNISENSRSQDELIALFLEDKKQSSSNLNNENMFKFILELQIGKNIIKIKFRDKVSTLKLTYLPRDSPYSVIPLYVICDNHDGRFQAPAHEDNTTQSALQRITLCSKLLQSVIAEKMYESNFHRKTFTLGEQCRIFHSKLNLEDALNLKSEELWEYLVREIMTSDIGCQEKKYLAFLSCTRYCIEFYSNDLKTYEDLVNITKGYVALGGGPLALFGTACLYTWPENIGEIMKRFENDTPVDRCSFLDDSCYRGTEGACFSTTLGSVLHELCHAFDLGHMRKGIMGRGFDNIHKVFTNHTSTIVNNETNIQWKKWYCNVALKDCMRTPLSSLGIKNDILSVKDDPDDTFWTKNCLVILYYHRWFNDCVKTNRSCSLKFDDNTYFVTSTCGIRIIEIRNEDDEMVLHYWIFEGKVLKFSFQIPPEIWKDLSSCDIVLFIEDNSSHTLKVTRRKNEVNSLLDVD